MTSLLKASTITKVSTKEPLVLCLYSSTSKNWLVRNPIRKYSILQSILGAKSSATKMAVCTVPLSMHHSQTKMWQWKVRVGWNLPLFCLSYAWIVNVPIEPFDYNMPDHCPSCAILAQQINQIKSSKQATWLTKYHHWTGRDTVDHQTIKSFGCLQWISILQIHLHWAASAVW